MIKTLKELGYEAQVFVLGEWLIFISDEEAKLLAAAGAHVSSGAIWANGGTYLPTQYFTIMLDGTIKKFMWVGRPDRQSWPVTSAVTDALKVSIRTTPN